MSRLRRALAMSLGTVAAAFSLGVNMPSSAHAQSADESDDAAHELADRHAPIFMLKEQSGPCDTNGEPFAPMSVELVLGNDDVTLRQAGTGDPVVKRGPVASDLFGRGDGFFLDFNGLALDPGCVYEQNFDSYSAGVDPVVYAQVVQQDGVDDRVAVQYWSYWYYNDWNNTHESDWEFVQVVFDATTVQEALASSPIEVGYAQHEGGERAGWEDDKLERDGDHPVVYSSAGSHASYFEPTIYLGRKGTEGVGCDTTTGPSVKTTPEVVLLPNSVDAETDEFAWLGFEGRWGERQSGPFNGPTGPNTKDQWTHPIDWQNALRSNSVTIPGGGENNGTVLDTFCSVVDFASNQLRTAQLNPTRLIAIVVAGALAVRWLARRTDWSAVPATPLRQRRRTGQMIRGAVTSYWHSGGGIAAVAIIYIPAAIIVGLVAGLASFTAGQTAVGLLSTVMLVLATASLTAFWHLASAERRAVVEAPRLVADRLGALAATVARAAAIVLVLGITVIGLPWAVRQSVRYAFVVPIVITEGKSGQPALARSAELVRGKWWRTAITVALFALLAFLVNSGLQLGLLVALSGLPLWAYLMVSFLATGVIVPLVATPSILLYGDAYAQLAVVDTAPSQQVDPQVTMT